MEFRVIYFVIGLIVISSLWLVLGNPQGGFEFIYAYLAFIPYVVFLFVVIIRRIRSASRNKDELFVLTTLDLLFPLVSLLLSFLIKFMLFPFNKGYWIICIWLIIWILYSLIAYINHRHKIRHHD